MYEQRRREVNKEFEKYQKQLRAAKKSGSKAAADKVRCGQGGAHRVVRRAACTSAGLFRAAAGGCWRLNGLGYRRRSCKASAGQPALVQRAHSAALCLPCPACAHHSRPAVPALWLLRRWRRAPSRSRSRRPRRRAATWQRRPQQRRRARWVPGGRQSGGPLGGGCACCLASRRHLQPASASPAAATSCRACSSSILLTNQLLPTCTHLHPPATLQWNDYTVHFEFPEPTELPPPLLQLIDAKCVPGRAAPLAHTMAAPHAVSAAGA